jgi:hypothetical protein
MFAIEPEFSKINRSQKFHVFLMYMYLSFSGIKAKLAVPRRAEILILVIVPTGKRFEATGVRQDVL